MPRGLDNDIARAQAENLIGGAIRVTDISGIGQKTEQDLRAQGFRDVQDIKGATVDELTDVPGIGQKTAQRAIREAGGDAAENARGSTGSVSAAGIRVPFGDFRVEISDHDNAEAKFETSMNRGIGRSEEAAQADKGKRAPVTTDLDEWKANKGELDFPGVDTPTEDPSVQEQDRRFISPDDLIGDAEDDFF